MRDVDQVIQSVQSIWPMVKVQQLRVSHPADDNGIWFFEQAGSEYEVQIESSDGMCPFLIETDENDNRFVANSVEDAVQILLKLLHLTSAD